MSVIPEISYDSSRVKNTFVRSEVITSEIYNELNKLAIALTSNNNLLDSNAMLFREEYNSSSKNLNNAIHQGIYSFTSSAVNAPSGVNGGNLLVTNTSKTNQGSSIITQIAFCYNGAIYIRTKNTTENFTNWILVSGNTGGIKSIQGSNDTLTITNGDNSTQDITINNVENSTKATQDSQGQTINTTYVKGITASNATLTLTKGNGTTSTVTINNVSNASVATKLGTITVGSSTKPIYLNNGTATACNIDLSTLSPKASPAFSGTPTAPTPETNDNGTRVATTAFVQSLLTQKFTASKKQNGWWKDGNTGLILQWVTNTPYFDVLNPSAYPTDNNGQLATINFPINFNVCLIAIPVFFLGDIQAVETVVAINNISNTSVTFRLREFVSTSQDLKICCLAIGY